MSLENYKQSPSRLFSHYNIEIIFQFKQNKFEGDLKMKLCGLRLYPTEKVNWLGVKIDRKFIWSESILLALFVISVNVKRFMLQVLFMILPFCHLVLTSVKGDGSFHKGLR